MFAAIACILAFVIGVGIGAASIRSLVRTGRVVIDGRVYLCKDAGPDK